MMAGEQQLTQWEPGIDWMNRYSNLLRKGRDYLNVYTGKHVGDAVFGGSPELVRGVAPTMNKLAGYLQQGTDFLNKAKVPEGVPLVGGAGVGDLTLGGAAKGLEHLSYGGSPFEGRGQTLKLRDDVFDLAGAVPAAAGVAKGAAGLAKGTGKFVGRELAARPTFVGDVVNKVMPGAGDLAKPPAVVGWQGSPALYGEVKPNYAGKGMGQQNYGEGAYIAAADTTGDRYRRMITGTKLREKFAEAGRNEFGNKRGNVPEAEVYRRVMEDPSIPMNQKMLIHALRTYDNNLGMGSSNKAVSQLLADPKKFNVSPETSEALRHFGYLYKIDIPDAHVANMMDWDKTLAEQKPFLKKLISAAHNVDNQQIRKSLDRIGDDQATTGEFIRALTNEADAADVPRIQRTLARELGNAGISGHTYPDPYTQYRTPNFVVYPHAQKDLKILERNGAPIDWLVQKLRAYAKR